MPRQGTVLKLELLLKLMLLLTAPSQGQSTSRLVTDLEICSGMIALLVKGQRALAYSRPRDRPAEDVQRPRHRRADEPVAARAQPGLVLRARAEQGHWLLTMLRL